MENSTFSIDQLFLDDLEISRKHLQEIVGLIGERERIFGDNVKIIVDSQLKWETKRLRLTSDFLMGSVFSLKINP
jgi:hypothetical protein